MIGISDIAGDVTELIDDARCLAAQSEERFRSLVQRLVRRRPGARRGRVILYASPTVERFGYRAGRGRRASGRDLIHPDDVERHRDRVRDVARSGTATVEWRFRVADGSYRWTEEVLTDMHDTPAVGGWVANIRDITDRRQAEAERTEAEERFRQGFERSAFGLAVLDLEQTFTSVNPALAELLGRPVDHLSAAARWSSCTRARATTRSRDRAHPQRRLALLQARAPHGARRRQHRRRS